MTDIRDIKASMFGEMLLRTAGAYTPRKDLFDDGFENPESVLYAFCVGCGTRMETTMHGLHNLSEDFGLNIPSDVSGCYISFNRCVYCNEQFTDASLQPIPAT